MNTKGVEDGIVCEFCGTHCYQGAEHNARVEDNARFNDPQPAVPVEERTAMHKDENLRQINRDMPALLQAVKQVYPIPEERTAEMGLLKEIVNGGYLDRFPEQKRRVLDHIEGKGK